VEDPPFGRAGLLGLYGAEHAELGMSGFVVHYAVFRGPADVDVPMPPRHAERDALIQLIFGRVGVGRVHGALQLVFEHRSPAIKQGSWLARVELDVSLP